MSRSSFYLLSPVTSTLAGRVARRCCSSSAADALARVGDRYDLTRRFTAADVSLFAGVSSDDNPMHTDAEYAAQGRFGSCVVHGMLVGSLFSAIVGQRFPGSIYLSQTFDFRKPVYVGETVVATIEVQDVRASGRMLEFVTSCTNEQGELAITGAARALLPRGGSRSRGRRTGSQSQSQ